MTNSVYIVFQKVIVAKETPKALGVIFDAPDFKKMTASTPNIQWIPKTQILPDSPCQHEGDQGELWISKWICDQKSLKGGVEFVHQQQQSSQSQSGRFSSNSYSTNSQKQHGHQNTNQNQNGAGPRPSGVLQSLSKSHLIYRKLATKYHPDSGNSSPEFMKDLNELWQAVKDDIKTVKSS